MKFIAILSQRILGLLGSKKIVGIDYSGIIPSLFLIRIG